MNHTKHRKDDIQPLPESSGQTITANDTDNSVDPAVKYPLLAALLSARGLQLNGTYTIHEIATIFDAKERTIQDWMHDGRMPSRSLPNHKRALDSDLEDFLQSSRRDTSDTQPGNRA